MKEIERGSQGKRQAKKGNDVVCATITLAACMVLAACGGGGGGSSSNSGGTANFVKLNSFQEADVVIGQADFVGSQKNQNGSVAANTLNIPERADLANGALFIADSYNNRVLGFNSLPTVDNMTADFVLAQSDFTSDAGGIGKNKMKIPVGVGVGNNKVAVADIFNFRVLIYNNIPTDGSAQPDVVVGQQDFTSGSKGCAQDRIAGPGGVAITPDGKLVVVDRGNHRVLIWNSVPSSSGQGADLVLGQNDFTHCDENDDDQDGTAEAAPTARTLSSPAGLWTDGKRLVVTDRNNNRVLIWSDFPTSNFQPADLVLGQSDFTHNARNDDDQDGTRDSEPSGRTLELPYEVDSNGVQLAIADQLNSRILVWNRFPTASFEPADVVLGQGDFKHERANDDDQNGASDVTPTARTLNLPSDVKFMDQGVLVSDSRNHRVLMYRSQ